jgi:beta-galactosidase/beta-glucuronidase
MTRWAKDVSPEKVHPEYPRPQMVRKEWQNLNGLWQLAFAKKGETAPIGKDLPRRILVPFPVESALSGVMKQADRLWYRRTFTIPKKWAGRRVLLHFGAVDWEAKVWVNGKKVGEHRGGYDPFSLDISKALKDTGSQELVVGVWDPTDAGTQPRGKQVNKPEGIFYTPTTGIWQTVWLEQVPKVYIKRLKIVPDVDGGKVRVSVVAGGKGPRCAVRMTASAGAWQKTTHKSSLDKPLELAIPKARLWSPAHPFLYRLGVELVHGDKVVDEVRSYFGMRKISVGKDDKGVTRLLLNNKFVFQYGPLDQGFWPDGLYTAPTDEALKYDIEVTKKLGFNMTRKHVKVEPARWYYWCDKLGLLVWQDMPSGDASVAPGKGEITRVAESAKQYRLELRRMIDALHNHPSIVMWVVFNEGWGQFDTVGVTKWTKEYDPTRLVNCASGWNYMKVGDVHDIHAYPAPKSPRPEQKRAAVLGEYGGLGLGIDGHAWSGKPWSYQGTKDRADLTRKYQKLAAEVWKLRDKPGLSAAVYTQITDVETESNGLLTYDRAVFKVDVEKVRAVNQGDVSGLPKVVVAVPTAREKAIEWRYTFKKPAAGWFKPDFDDSAWKKGPAGFGTEGTPGAVVRTVWNTSDIWIRREFTMPKGKFKNLHLNLHHDEDAEMYINGVLAATLTGYLIEYEEFPITAKALAAIKPGKNYFAVHCKNTTGGQYIDVGLVEIK